MENMFTRTILYGGLFISVMTAGYLVGLVTLPTRKPIEAVKESTIPLIDTTLQNNTNLGQNGYQPVAALPELPELPTVSVDAEINPFNNNVPQQGNHKVINMPAYNGNGGHNGMGQLKHDPRVTIIPRNNNNTDSFVGTQSGKVEIEITGEEPLSQIEKKRLIDDLSTITNKKPQAQNTPINNPLADPYAPRVPLITAPKAGYYDKTKHGYLPKTPEGQKPLWQVYANPTKINHTKKPIAYIVGGLGIDYDLTLEAIKTLPAQITLGFVPYAKDIQKLIDLARQYGHETILEIPMETHDFPRPDSGILALTTADSEETYQNKLNSLLSVATGYSGVMNYLGSKYILDETATGRFMNDLKMKGLYFVENKTMRSGILAQMAQANHVPYGASFEILDEVLNVDTISNNYNMIEKNTQIGQPTIATTYLSALSLSVLKTRLMLQERNDNNPIQLIPISGYIGNK